MGKTVITDSRKHTIEAFVINKRFYFGLCAATPSLVDQVKRIASEQNIDLEVSLNTLDNAIPDAKRMEADGVEVILAGSTTGVFLAESITIPVVVFRINSSDSIQTFFKAAKKAKRILIPALRQKPVHRKLLAEALNVHMKYAVYQDSQSLRQCLEKAKEKGYELVLGGGYITQYARQIGLATVDFARSDGAVQEAINSAIAIGRSARVAREQSHRYRIILDTASDGVIAVSETGIVTAINRTACNLLGLRESDVIGLPVEKNIPGTLISEALAGNQPYSDSIENFKQKSFVWNHQPFEVAGDVAGCVSTFNEISSVIRAENKIRRTLSKGHVARYSIKDFLHRSEVMIKTVDTAKQFARTDSNLLITGETGTGKEILVQSVHNLSDRKSSPFVSINCAALPDQLLESELFGYEEGAFTGSRKGGKAGLFELAHKGTIFLDEIGETSEHVQIRLLRILQEREIMRLGGDRLVSIDVRVIAASNRDLAREVQKGRFRSDLFFRLKILHIKIPPLRDRLEDIPVLLEEFLRFYSGKNGTLPFEIPKPYLEKLKEYPWPGNVRQLQNFTEQLVLLSRSKFDPLLFDSVYDELFEHFLVHREQRTQEVAQTVPTAPPVSVESEKPEPGDKLNLKQKMDQLSMEKEKQLLQAALEGAKYSKVKAAEALGMSRTTLWRKLKEVGLE